MAPGGKAFIFNFPPGVLLSARAVPDHGAIIYRNNFNSFAGCLGARARLLTARPAVAGAAT